MERSTHNGNFRDPGFSTFSENGRFGYLYDDPGSYQWYGTLEDQSLNLLMNFRMKDTTRFRHEFLAGIKKVEQKVFWLQGEDPDYKVLKGRSELMKFVVGYRFYALKKKRIRFSVGSQLDYGFTVSSFTRQTDFDSEYEYYGHKQEQVSLEFPIQLELRILKGPYIQLGPSYGLGYFTHDGIGQVIFTRNFMAGFRIDI